MKLIYITDTHLGARQGSKIFRNYFRTFWEQFFASAKENNIEQIIHGGDFFDTRAHVCAEDIKYIKEEFNALVNEYKIPITIIAGNHDVAYKDSNDTNSLILLDSPYITRVINNPDIQVFGTQRYALVPWINANNYDKMVSFIERNMDEDTILIGHFEIAGMKMYKSGSVCDHGIDPELFKGYKKVLSGHFHHSSKYNNIEYLGSPFCLTWQDYGDWRGYWIHDLDKDVYSKIETTSHLFSEIKYGQDYEESDISNKFVKIIIDKEYTNLGLKDLLATIQELQPIKVIVDDRITLKTIVVDDTDNDGSVETSIVSYFAKAITDNDVLQLAESIIAEAETKLAKGEV